MREKLKITQGISIDVGNYPSEVDTFFLYCGFLLNFKVQGLLKKGFSLKILSIRCKKFMSHFVEFSNTCRNTIAPFLLLFLSAVFIIVTDD